MGIEFYKPKTLNEATTMLVRYGTSAASIAGGTDIMVATKSGRSHYERLVSVSGLSELQGISWTEDGGLRLGAATTLSHLLDHVELCERYPVLRMAAAVVGCYSVRNRATVGGNLCNASPAGDLAPALLTLDAELELTGPGGLRALPLSDFFTGPGKTALHSGELLTAVLLPPRTKHGAQFLKLGVRKAMEVSIASAACVLEKGEDGICIHARLALGAVAPIPLVVPECAELLKGRPISAPDEVLIARIAEAASEAARPISDIRASAAYRKRMAGVLAGRAVAAAWEWMEG